MVVPERCGGGRINLTELCASVPVGSSVCAEFNEQSGVLGRVHRVQCTASGEVYLYVDVFRESELPPYISLEWRCSMQQDHAFHYAEPRAYFVRFSFLPGAQPWQLITEEPA